MFNNLVCLIQFEEIVIRLSCTWCPRKNYTFSSGPRQEGVIFSGTLCRMNFYKVLIFVSPFNSLIVHGSGVFTLDSCHLSVHLVSVFAFSHPVHWVSLVTGHSPSMQTPEPEQNTRLSLVNGSSSRALIGHLWLCAADRRGSHDAQSSVWKSGLFIAARTQLAAFCTPVTSHTRVNFHSRDPTFMF